MATERSVVPGEQALNETLMAMPSNGGWMLGTGPYSPTLMIMLDDCSLLVEENIMSVHDVPTVWRVRLTMAGIAMRKTLVRLRSN
jgi:hypothetical protein